MRQSIAIVAAMPEERDALLTLFPEHASKTHFNTVLHAARHGNQELVIALAGVGKTNAACTLALLLSDFDIGCVINIGSAGGLRPEQQILDLVVPHGVVYTDVDVTPFGFAYGQMYGEPPRFYPDPRLLACFDALVAEGRITQTCHHGLLGSADAFITRPDQLALIRDKFHGEVACVECEQADEQQIDKLRTEESRSRFRTACETKRPINGLSFFIRSSTFGNLRFCPAPPTSASESPRRRAQRRVPRPARR